MFPVARKPYASNLIDLRASILHNRYMNKIRIAACVLVFAAFLCASISSPGQDAYTQKKFFTAERFYVSAELLAAFTADPGARKDIKVFTEHFTGGVYALSIEDYRAALNNLYKARRVWPEYYGTDFLIALALEGIGDTRKAARFYKGYLDKLRILESGHYPISASLIRALNVGSIDNYAESSRRIEHHLARYDIDLARVKPPTFIPDFAKNAFFIFLLIVAGFIANYTVVPYLKMRDRIKNAAPGYWVCRKCGEANPDLVKECAKCGSSGVPRPKGRGIKK